jgi:CBS domain-containing protein
MPVLENGRLSAIVSSRDIMEAVLEEAKTQRNVMAEAYEMVR